MPIKTTVNDPAAPATTYASWEEVPPFAFVYTIDNALAIKGWLDEIMFLGEHDGRPWAASKEKAGVHGPFRLAPAGTSVTIKGVE